MSVRVMSLVWGWALPATEKLVALKLADCSDDAGRNAWPAVATIATDCGLTRRGTQKVLERLITKGCIEVQSGWTNRKSTTYRVMLNAQLGGEPSSPQTSARGEPRSPLEVNHVPVEANDVRPRGEPRSPLEVNDVRPIHPVPVLDPSGNPRARDGRPPHPLDEAPRTVLSTAVLAVFDELWKVYPNPDNELGAMRAWVALNPTVDLAQFILAHVRMRLAAGWARENPRKFLPQLKNFIEDKRWNDRRAVQTAAHGPPEGLVAMRSCDRCGDVLEGSVVAGVPTYPPCPRCARAGSQVVHERVGERI